MPYTLPGPISILKSYPNHPAYFENLVNLDAYLKDLPTPVPPPAAPLRPRANVPLRKGKLCVCHDMAGGYPDDAHNPMWTMQWWALADTFIYFSHHRVSPPPREWASAGHRQGCKVLGTLILEGANDRYRILTGTDTTSITEDTNSISKLYADYLIDLCELRGFDGYLLNFEVSYENAKNARLLGAWVAYLRSESRRRLGADRSVIMWYDSVTVDGSLSWQNTLNQRNSAFFIGSDSFFTNYNYGNATIPAAKNFLENLVGDTRPTSDVSWGIDMWGRGTYEGGGYRACLALNTIQPGIAPPQRGFSASVFAPAYLWENDVFQPHDRPSWWARDTLLWVGRSTEQETQEALKRLNTDPAKQLAASDFRPLKDYFPFQPQTLPFATNFSLGAGTFFNVQGKEIQPGLTWSDHEWVAALPDLAMPCSLATAENGRLVIIESDCIADAKKVWTGGHSVQLSCSNYKKEYGVLSAPIITVDLVKGPEYDCVTMFEVTWYQIGGSTASSTGSRVVGLKAAHAGKRVAPSYNTTEIPASQSGWIKTTAFFKNLSGVVEFIVDLDYHADPTIPIILGALSVRAVSGTASGNDYIPNRTYIDATDLDFKLVHSGNDYVSTLLFRGNVRPPVANGPPTSNPAWPTICQTTLNEDEVIYEVTTYLVTAQGTRAAMAWGTTSMGRQTISWSDKKTRDQINEVESKGGFVAFKVQALDGAGWYAGSAAELWVTFRDSKILH
ncbi:glycoside hydrolase family 85 protein [Calocera viscosa TUFC12733]|uniref:Glycoside hydrolase family 85 protein n=1 Tax=Calocera viscosa (strain TUFC12733) TaxID=1330018 RepID=A0A167IPY7_CALVF|nr:glycoside hydrolase family 85 protein [Calocera viscosa TUFC12733]